MGRIWDDAGDLPAEPMIERFASWLVWRVGRWLDQRHFDRYRPVYMDRVRAVADTAARDRLRYVSDGQIDEVFARIVANNTVPFDQDAEGGVA